MPWGSDIGRTLFAKLGELLVERWSHFHGQALHNILHQRLSDGNTVKIHFVVKVLHDVQVSLQGLDLGGEVFGDLLD